ncbi:amino acid transporter AVT1I-like [Silene latifolia]|uniref:amino acid transporter AVT1I-like n=1 Tax=Silene latifolia TaxID=37657 RepID=UPI003D788759
MESDGDTGISLGQPLLELTQPSVPENNTSFLKTVFNSANAILGNGVLLVPYALATGGWLSIILLFTIFIAAAYTGLVVTRCLEVDPRIKSYPDIGEHAFGITGKTIVLIILYADLYISTTGFLILEGDNLHNLFPNIGIEMLGVTMDGKSTFIVLTALVVLPTVILDDFSILGYISASGVLASVLILGSVLWVGAIDGVGFHQKGSLLEWNGLSTTISLYMFCYSAHLVLPPLYNSMQDKTRFSRVVLTSFSLSTLIYAPMAIFGYMMFGPNMKTQITLNLPTENLSSQIAIYTTLVTPLTKYALILKPAIISLESWFKSSYTETRYFKLVLRTSLVATQVVVALCLPFFTYLMSLTGALLCATGSLAIPCLCYLKFSSINLVKLRIVEKIFLCGIVFLSMLIMVFGTYTSLAEILAEIIELNRYSFRPNHLSSAN